MAFKRAMIPRKEKQWDGLAGSTIDMTANGTFGGGSLAFTSNQTILRMLGSWQVMATATIIAGDECEVAIGIAKVSTDAATLGVTALPDPFDEPEFPWLYWATRCLYYAEGGAPVLNRTNSGTKEVVFDIRTMRKFKPRESLVAVFQYVDIVGAPPVTLQMGKTRLLTTIH